MRWTCKGCGAIADLPDGMSLAGKQYCNAACQELARARRDGRRCRRCGAYLTIDQKLYCSMECYAASQRKPADRTCDRCGKPFVVKASQANRRFCTRACYDSWRRINRPTRKSPEVGGVRACALCGREFWEYHSQPRKYCSQRCYRESRFPDQLRTAKCERCGKTFSGVGHKMKGNHGQTRRYCSTECRVATYRTGRYFHCVQCDKVFYVPKARADAGLGRWCGKECESAWRKGKPQSAYRDDRTRIPAATDEIEASK